MQIVNRDGHTIHIRIGKYLDISACHLFSQAWDLTEQTGVRNIVIDLAQTSSISDSGLALLLLLRERTEGQVGPIKLANCSADLISRVSHIPLVNAFDLVSS